jgi:aspartyl protease family protein
MKNTCKKRSHLSYCMAWPLFLMSSLAMGASVGVVGLFKDKAMVSVNGGSPKLISAGQTVHGVKLISASSEAAVLEVEGKRHTLTMGQSFAAQAGNGGKPSATLNADSRGHFATQGAINGGNVTFLVDTGATSVTLQASDAARLGIPYKSGRPVGISTANGVVPAWRVTFNSVKVGGITLHQIEGMVVESGLEVALLGMSFLNRTDMKREGQTMTLTQRY